MKVKFSLQIHSSASTLSTGDVWLEREHEFQSVPRVGDTVGDVVISEVAFDWDGGVTCFAEDREFYGRGGLRDWSGTDEFKEHVAEYEKAGWKREAQMPAPAHDAETKPGDE